MKSVNEAQIFQNKNYTNKGKEGPIPTMKLRHIYMKNWCAMPESVKTWLYCVQGAKFLCLATQILNSLYHSLAKCSSQSNGEKKNTKIWLS